jgi:RNA polymerase sigma-70 factor, ECF subfamily
MDPNDPAAVTAALDAVRRGNKDAYQAVVRAYHLVVRTYLCAHVYHMDDVDDLAQDVFLTAYRSLPSMPAGVEFAAWLKGIARHKVQNFRRGAARRNRAMEQFRETAARVSEAELEEVTAADDPELIERLLDCIGRLPDKLRKVVRSGLDGHKPAALAEELGTSVGAIYTLHYRANQLLRACVRGTVS